MINEATMTYLALYDAKTIMEDYASMMGVGTYPEEYDYILNEIEKFEANFLKEMLAEARSHGKNPSNLEFVLKNPDSQYHYMHMMRKRFEMA